MLPLPRERICCLLSFVMIDDFPCFIYALVRDVLAKLRAWGGMPGQTRLFLTSLKDASPWTT